MQSTWGEHPIDGGMTDCPVSGFHGDRKRAAGAGLETTIYLAGRQSCAVMRPIGEALFR